MAFHEEAKAQQVIEFGILHKIVPYFVGKVSRYRSSSTIPRRFMEELEGIAEVTSQWNPELNVERVCSILYRCVMFGFSVIGFVLFG